MSAFSAHQSVHSLLLWLEQAESRLITMIAVLCCAINLHSAEAEIATCASEVPPSEQLGELFRNVQLKEIFPDSKTFADLQFDESPSAILADYEARKVEPGFDLGVFVHRHFPLPAERPTVQPASPGEPIETYIVRLWDVLRHQSDHMSVGPFYTKFLIDVGPFGSVSIETATQPTCGLGATPRTNIVDRYCLPTGGHNSRWNIAAPTSGGGGWGLKVRAASRDRESDGERGLSSCSALGQ
jgi:hypothetical protein